LKNSEVIKQYGDKIQLQNTEVANETYNGNWAVCKRIITEVANEVIPKENRECYDDECKEATKKKFKRIET
jgi:hypothetical protein